MFMSAVIAGSFIIYYVNFRFDIGSENIWISPISMFFVVLIYILITLALGLHRADGVIDTYYYLGFIFTLISMIAAFAMHSDPGKLNDSSRIATLISQNGVALISTVVGLIGRLMAKISLQNDDSSQLNYLHPNKEEIDHYVKLLAVFRETSEGVSHLVEISEKASTARKNISDLNSEFLGFNEQTVNLTGKLQGLHTSVADLNASLERANEASVKQVEHSEAAIAALSDGISDYRDIFQNVRIRIQNDIETLVSEILDHIKTIDPKVSNLEKAHEELLSLYTKLNDAALNKANSAQ